VELQPVALTGRLASDYLSFYCDGGQLDAVTNVQGLLGFGLRVDDKQ
jgi:hypothetical protein